MAPEHVQSALEQGQLNSAYSRLGGAAANEEADQNVRRRVAVCTRAVGTQQANWKAGAMALRGNDSKVQLILSPRSCRTPAMDGGVLDGQHGAGVQVRRRPIRRAFPAMTRWAAPSVVEADGSKAATAPSTTR